MSPKSLGRVLQRCRGEAPSFARRLVHFLAVWPLLLAAHEGGHAIAARQQGLAVRQVSVGIGPVLWERRVDDTRLALRLLPVVGVTGIDPAEPSHTAAAPTWRGEAIALAGGVVATLIVASAMAGLVAAWEGTRRRRWVWGRIVIADAIVITVFNFLPVPPLDGGRVVLGTIAALTGAPLSNDALFWIHIGGLALAVVPMMLWTRWTARIDALVLWWGAPTPRR
ncbi:MAG TPA: site-2 protease family protein [Gemmatimonadaceae bacterium]